MRKSLIASLLSPITYCVSPNSHAKLKGMKKVFFFVLLLPCLFVLSIFSHPSKTLAAGEPCACQINSGGNACIETSPPICEPSEICECAADIDPFFGQVTFCYPGTCALAPSPTPTFTPIPTPTPAPIISGCATINPPMPIEREAITITLSETIKNHTYWVGLERPKGMWAVNVTDQIANYDGHALTFSFIAPRAGTYWLTANSREIAPPCINKQEFTIASSGGPTPPGGQFYRCKFTTKECILCDAGSTDSTCIHANVSDCSASCQSVAPIDPFLGEISCLYTSPGGEKITGIRTAIGCIPTENANVFIKWLLGRAVMIAGGIAFLLMIGGTFMVILSAGNPEQVKAGSQLITSAIAGLVFIIFSLFLLRLIGVEILGIPGL